ncbi:MAG: hypothetical protein CMJ18_23015 [Phycisphaeraceae bacterium]|nr:hypothetical protein [Phycisphaeraceae bacterium]
MRSRVDLWILVGLFAFALAFLFGARWLGQQDRARYKLVPLPPWTSWEARLVSRLEILTPRFPHLAQWSSANGDAARAEAALKIEAADRAGRTADSVVDLAVLRLLQARAAEAVAVAKSGRAAFADDARIALVLGLASEAVSDLEGARREFEHAEALSRDDVDVLYRLGRLHLEADRPREARLYAERAVRVEPRHPEAQRLLARSCLATNDAGRAKRAYNDVLQLLPGDPAARDQLSVLDGSPR